MNKYKGDTILNEYRGDIIFFGLFIGIFIIMFIVTGIYILKDSGIGSTPVESSVYINGVDSQVNQYRYSRYYKNDHNQAMIYTADITYDGVDYTTTINQEDYVILQKSIGKEVPCNIVSYDTYSGHRTEFDFDPDKLKAE